MSRETGQAGGRTGSAASRDTSFFLPRGYIDGCILSNHTDAAHDISIAAGWCVDSSRSVVIDHTSAIVKQIDASWAAGSAAGGFPDQGGSGLTLSNATTYHVFLIMKLDGTIDAGFDTNLDASVLRNADNAGTDFVYYRRVGSVITDGSANILAFQQFGDWFYFMDPVSEAGLTTPGTSVTTETVTVPTGLSVMAILSVFFEVDDSADSQNQAALQVGHPDSAFTAAVDQDGGPGSFGLGSSGSATDDRINTRHMVYVWTNTSAQIDLKASEATDDVAIDTFGWMDPRGRNA